MKNILIVEDGILTPETLWELFSKDKNFATYQKEFKADMEDMGEDIELVRKNDPELYQSMLVDYIVHAKQSERGL